MGAPHALVVGGTGMLAAAVDGLAASGWAVSVIARRAGAFASGRGGGVHGFDADYHDADAFDRAVATARRELGDIALAVAWFHSLKIDAPRRLAERIGGCDGQGRLFQVLGSGVADPGQPHRLAAAAAVAQGLPNCRLRQIVLGFVVEGARARWLTHAEISAGVLRAVADDAVRSVIGQVEPWAMRPAG